MHSKVVSCIILWILPRRPAASNPSPTRSEFNVNGARYLVSWRRSVNNHSDPRTNDEPESTDPLTARLMIIFGRTSISLPTEKSF
jgi:hypothetical protein